MHLSQPLELPCGARLPNRIAKAAMSEQLARSDGHPGRGLERLYHRWARGGAGLIITGNVMIDPSHRESHMNAVLTRDSDLAPFRRWATAGRGAPLWMQINHTGRQCPRHMNPRPMAPSEVESVAMFRSIKAFGRPRAMSEAEIEAVIARFATTARLAKEAGFDGVQIHGAHGYLVSQFLSPRTNRREDAWGGSLEGRARFLREVVRAVRGVVGGRVPVGVKLNSADFQRGGFAEGESMQVLGMLEAEGVDLIEISGGNYESKAMFNLDADQREDREAYFLDYARRARRATQAPLMVTGGFRSAAAMEDALAEGALDVVGMARPFANNPDIARDLIEGRLERALPPVRLPLLYTASVASEAMLSVAQMSVMARGVDPNGVLGPFLTAILGILGLGRRVS